MWITKWFRGKNNKIYVLDILTGYQEDSNNDVSEYNFLKENLPKIRRVVSRECLTGELSELHQSSIKEISKESRSYAPRPFSSSMELPKKGTHKTDEKSFSEETQSEPERVEDEILTRKISIQRFYDREQGIRDLKQLLMMND